ncbi:hypothetical protein MUK42_21293 [Musa troglodytarum]|uniref:PAP/OAS1 substrate-binding-related domain-containing protein n=1 Tax=Musa troglodytarum TaxID=320322 RepID=A0A9E7G386_9LILI|nr:hypothetical protein MUK42_21293 [Musa troglodytarum]
MGEQQDWPPLANGGFSEGFSHPMPTNPDLSAVGPGNLIRAEQATAAVLRCIRPTVVSEQRRKAVVEYIQKLLKRYIGIEVFPFGSVPLKTYLPDGDIDLTALSFPNSEDALANDVRSVLQSEEQNKGADFEVKDVQYINAEVFHSSGILFIGCYEVKLVKCIVENIVVDISFNQIGGLCTLCFLEKVDQEIGKENLFKRSIILIKTWCYYESRILGAHHGLISTYALETLVLYVFHLFHESLDGPLAVLYRFLDYYSKFDWDNYCVSLRGPIPVSFLPELVVEPLETNEGDLLLSKEFIKECVNMFSVPPRFSESSRIFLKKHLNIVDPLKQNNNLGRSVSKGNFYRIRSAFTYGARKLGRVLLLPAENIAAEVGMFFASTLERHGTGERPDVQQAASPSCSDSRFIEHNEVGSTASNNESTLDSQVKCSSAALCDDISSIKISDLVEGYGTELQFNGHNSDKHLDGLHKCTKMENHLMGGEASVEHLDKNARDLVNIEAFNLRAAESCLDSSSHNQIGGGLSSGKAYHAPRLFFHVGNGSESVILDNVNSGHTAKKEVISSRFVAPCEEPNNESESHGTSTSGFKTNSVSASTGSIHGFSTSWNSHLSEYLNTAACSCEGNGNSCPNCSKLSDLVGDFNLHYMNLLYALNPQGQEYFMNQYFMPNYGLSPSQYQNKQSWNGFSQQSIYMHIRANGVIPAPPFSLNPGVYGAKDIQKTKGTGTYFPNTNSRSYRERQSPGRGKNQTPPNQLSRSRNNSRLEVQDRNLLEGNNETLPQPHSPVFTGVPQPSCSANRGLSHGNDIVLDLKGKLEFGSLGPVKLGVSSPEQSKRLESVSPSYQSSAAILESTVQRPSTNLRYERSMKPYQLKDESDFPPLNG